MQNIRDFEEHPRECAVQMMMNALYIQREFPNVQMSDALRQVTEGLCSILIGTKHDLVSEIFELDERLQDGASNVEVLRRVNRIVQWAGEDALKMHEIVMALDAELQKGVVDGGAYLLVSESAVNILTPLHEMRQLAAELTEVLA